MDEELLLGPVLFRLLVALMLEVALAGDQVLHLEPLVELPKAQGVALPLLLRFNLVHLPHNLLAFLSLELRVLCELDADDVMAAHVFSVVRLPPEGIRVCGLKLEFGTERA